jgi:predicted nucleic acid-binding protein
MLYLDASLLTALVTDEDRSPRVQRWFDDQDPQELVISPWCLTEVASALSVKERTGDLIAPDRARADRLMRVIATEGAGVAEVVSADYETAARMCGRAELSLRAGDALHLAVVGRLGATLHTLDEGQAAAAGALAIDAVITVEKG